MVSFIVELMVTDLGMLSIPLKPPIAVGDHERVWFLPENGTTYDSFEYDVIHDPETIWLSQHAHAIVPLPPTVSTDSNHPFVHHVPVLLRCFTVDTLTWWVGCVLGACLALQLLIVVFEWCLLVHSLDEDHFVDAIEPPPDFGADGGGEDLVVAAMDQLRIVIALQMHLRDVLADDDGDVFVDAADELPEGHVALELGQRLALDANIGDGGILMDGGGVQVAAAAALILIGGLARYSIGGYEWFGSFVWDPGGMVAVVGGFYGDVVVPAEMDVCCWLVVGRGAGCDPSGR